MRISIPRPLLLLLGGLLLLNLLQAFATELIWDEAYYWYFSQNPAWGYFDHPPMVAWMIGAGTLLFDNELGVRLIACLLGTGILYLLWILTDHPEKNRYWKEFFVWGFSMTLLQAYGFFSLPDTALLFFTALFLLLYRAFLREPGWGVAILLGICMAALMYSKYHAALVILLVLASNLKLLKNRFAWVALGISLVCYLPHLLWLYDHDFVSVRFHLFERPNQPYSFTKLTLGYFLNLLALFGFTFPFAYRALLQTKSRNRFEKALLYLTYGFLIFFFLSSFQRRVQTQWLVVICIPMGILVAQNLMSEAVTRKWIWRLGLVNILILGWLRVALVFQEASPKIYESHGNKEWVREVDSVARGGPVVFANSYQRASMYQFYSRKPSFSLNNAFYRKNQYSIDGSEEIFRGADVYYVYKRKKNGDHYFRSPKGDTIYGTFIEDFNPYRRLAAGVSEESNLIPGEQYRMWLYNPYEVSIPASSLQFGITYLDYAKKPIETRPIAHDNLPSELLRPKDTVRFNFVMPPPLKPRAHYARAVISENGLPWGINGSPQKIQP